MSDQLLCDVMLVKCSSNKHKLIVLKRLGLMLDTTQSIVVKLFHFVSKNLCTLGTGLVYSYTI